jgi:hypothetical protein
VMTMGRNRRSLRTSLFGSDAFGSRGPFEQRQGGCDDHERRGQAAEHDPQVVNPRHAKRNAELRPQKKVRGDEPNNRCAKRNYHGSERSAGPMSASPMRYRVPFRLGSPRDGGPCRSAPCHPPAGALRLVSRAVFILLNAARISFSEGESSRHEGPAVRGRPVTSVPLMRSVGDG